MSKYFVRLVRVAWTVPLVISSLALAGEAPAGQGKQSNLLANGSFEFWCRYTPEALREKREQGVQFDGDDPLLPIRWEWVAGKPTRIGQTTDAHSGKYALAINSAWAELTLQFAELNPGATYSYGIWVKGKGNVEVKVHGVAVEGLQELGRANGTATDQWQRVGGSFVAPGHLRMARLTVLVGGNKDLVLDDGFIAAPLEAPYDADAVLKTKPVKDADTIFFEDFEKDNPAIRLVGKAHLTAKGGGRFGRGLRMDKPDMAVLPFALESMPKEGTIECWVSPEKLPAAPQNAFLLQVRSSSRDLGVMNGASWWTWCIDGNLYHKSNFVWGSRTFVAKARAGQWTHLAVTWDPSAVRMYVDGVLAHMQTQPPLNWWPEGPVNIAIGAEHEGGCWSGVIDEIRVSKVKRYGPIIPKGSKAVPLPVPEMVAEAAPAAARKPAAEKPAVDIAAERKKLIGAIPPTRSGLFESEPTPAGDYVYEATSARPLAQGDKFSLEVDRPVKGLTTVETDGIRRWIGDLADNGGAYWRLRGIKPGKYWVGLVYQSNPYNDEKEAKVLGSMAIYLNGRIIQCSTIGDPVQVAPGVWYAELQSAQAEPLQEGDEISATHNWQLTVARLILHAKEPRRGAFRTGLNFGGHAWTRYPALRVNADVRFVGADGKNLGNANEGSYLSVEQETGSPRDFLHAPDGRAIARCRVANPLSKAVTVDYECVIKGYYGQVAGRDAQQLTLQPHAAMVRDVPFETTPDDPAYSAEATIKCKKGPDLGWPATDTVDFFPGYRQSVPWQDPFSFREMRRVKFTRPVRDVRYATSLNGKWEWAFTPELELPMPIPAGLKFESGNIPSNTWSGKQYKDASPPHGAYVRRTFELPQDRPTGTIRLVVKEVVSAATAYVNGQKVGQVRGENTPLVADISNAVKPGANELVIVAQDMLALMDPEYINRKSPTINQYYEDAPGLRGWNQVALGEVSLEVSPPVAAADVLVITSVRNSRLGARATLVNHTGQAVRAVVKATVLDARRPVLELGQKEVTLEPGRPEQLAFDKEWSHPRLWSPEDPHLYVLAVETVDAASGQRLDLARQRFGFRESWIEGPRIFFNGHPVKFKGRTGGPIVGTLADYQLSRGACAPDYMDEFGYPAVEMITAVCNAASRHNVERDAYWETATKNMFVAGQRLQNHPCILGWDLSNEWLGFLYYAGADPMLGAKRFQGLSDQIGRQDPTRWTMFNGDGDLNGLHDNGSYHYITPFGGHSYSMDGHTPFYPDGIFWRPIDPQQRPSGDPAVVGSPAWWVRLVAKKVVMNTENLWKTSSSLLPPGLTRFVGEEDVLSPAVDDRRGPIAWMWKQNLDGHRDLGTSAVMYYPGLAGVDQRGYRLQTFIMPDVVHHGFAGRTVVRRYDLLNDLFRPAELAFTWRLLGSDGKVLVEGRDIRKMGSADLKTGMLSFALPNVGQRTTCTLDLRLESDGQFVCGEQRDFDVWPNAAVTARQLERQVLLFDPGSASAAALQASGIPFTPVTKLVVPEAQAGRTLVVIGEGALDAASAAQTAKLEKFVNAGGRVLILAQTVTPGGLPVITKLEPREWVAQAFIRMGTHPILEGLSDWDLHFWAADRVVARGAYTKPEGGAALPLVDSGSDSGLEWTELLELYRGKGLYLLCQLPVVSKWNDEPMARELFARMLGYAGGDAAFAAPVRCLKVVTAKAGAIEKRLGEVGVRYELAKADEALDGTSVVLVDAAQPATEAQRGAWASALEAGATIVVCNAQASDAAWLGKLAGQAVRLTVPPYYMWQGRGYRNGFDPLTAGLSHLDVYWKRYDGEAFTQAEDPRLTIEPLQDWSAGAATARELVFPGALVELPVGKGRLVLDQRRWWTGSEKLLKLANRNVSALMLGLGVQIAPVIAERELPKVVDYRLIDLRPLANRALVDDVAEDGRGGWTDQGPRADLRTFPTGKRDFQGAPFVIGEAPRSCIVLRSDSRPFPEKMPAQVTIPVGYPVEGLWFLHGSAYGGENVALYQIEYADGTTTDVPLYEGVNIRDWSATPGPFLREKTTRSSVAWTGSCPMFNVIAVYKMLWVNPRPDAPVKAVHFSNPEKKAVPILIGLTAVLPHTAGPAQNAEAAAKAKGLLEQAGKAVAANDDAKARGLLKEAIACDPALEAAHRALADLCERKGDEDAALAAYRAWAVAGAKTPHPYNRIGQILERRKDDKGALEAYTRSLQIEWNQPPVIEAKSRLEKTLNEK